jgi:hypothetical protein
MFEKSLTQIVDRWKEAFGEYGALRAAAEPDVVRWEWAPWGDRYSLLPFYFQRYPGRVRALKAPPAPHWQHVQYGLDARDRPRLHRFYVTLEQAFEAFYTYGEEMAERVEFSIPPRIPLQVQRVFYDGGRVVRHVLFRLNGYTPLYSQKKDDPEALYQWLGPEGRFEKVEEYLYEGDRLTAILTYDEAPGAGAFQAEERLTYDGAGKLLRIDRVSPDGRSQLVYQKRAKGETFASIRQAATEKLVEAIVETLRAADLREPLYCIELSYLSGNRPFPPCIIPGPESRRQALLASADPGARHLLFSQVFRDPETWLEIDEPGVLEACARLEQEIEAGQRWTAATRVLRDVAATLSHRDWTGILDVTPDFVVYAIDHELEGDRLEQVLRASTSADQIREWKRKGWL